jgi:RNA polymerase sigma-70 factor (ECF subfamily)
MRLALRALPADPGSALRPGIRATLFAVSTDPRERAPAAVAAPPGEGERLAARAAAGDLEAFGQLYDAHATAVRGIARRFFTRPFEQEEAIQEIWIQVHRALRSFDPARGAVGPWLHTVALNRCREMLRAARRRPDGAEALAAGDGRDPLAASGDDPEQTVQARRLQAAVAAFAARLQPPLAEVLRLSFVEELPHEEIARRLGISVRRSKYLKKLVLARAERDPGMRAALRELAGSDR